MYFQAPHDIYGSECFRLFMDDIGGNSKAISKYLGVSENTLLRWIATERVPRAAVLALFWESKYGRSSIFTNQVNEIRLLYREVCLLREQFQRAKDIVTGLRAMHTGSANEPLFEELPDFLQQFEPSIGTNISWPIPIASVPEEKATGTTHSASQAGRHPQTTVKPTAPKA
jgi:hypothetical protein